jgi:hypothetical protein
MAHVNDAVGEGEFVAASGGLLIVQGAGAVVGPLIAGLAMSFLQRGLSSTIITAQVLIVAFGVYRLRQRAAPPALHKRTFVVEPAIPGCDHPPVGTFSRRGVRESASGERMKLMLTVIAWMFLVVLL